MRAPLGCLYLSVTSLQQQQSSRRDRVVIIVRRDPSELQVIPWGGNGEKPRSSPCL